ncbi:MAG: PepSY-associated TM helix domain-containing protein [Undibacterium curvum]|uniref:PepSY-associated TM helix domain-containing protein n=1 Tax=Undibacterium curvum TaxID=2762294 RepID=UPI003BDAE45D
MKIRSDILRIYQSLHTWVGITTGMLLFIGFFAGALTMFKQPLDRWISPPASHGASAPVAMNPAQLDELVRAMLQQRPEARQEFTLHLTQQENIAAPLSWTGSESGHELDLSAQRWLGTLNEAGQFTARAETPSLLAELIDMLHRTAGIPGTLGDEYLGTYLMGIAGAMYFLALVSGVILLLPTLVKDFFALRPGKNRKRFWLDAHNIIGILSLPFHVLISITVVVFAFHDLFYGSLSRVVYGDTPMFTRPAVHTSETHNVANMLPVSALIEKLQQAAPDASLQEILFMGLEGPRPVARAALLSPEHLVQGPQAAYVLIQPYTGQVIDTSMLPGQGNVWSALTIPFFSLHFGSFGGDLMRWVYFVFGLSGAFLFYSGNLLWVEKRRKNQQANQQANQPAVIQSRATRWMAAATVGVCLGAIAAVCFTMVAGKLMYAWVSHINHAYLTVYYSVFVVALCWAFWRGAARAAVDLLAVCSIAALAIPLTSLLAWLLPGSGVWMHLSLASLSVDLVGFVAALMFAWACWLTARRVRHGPKDSVWAA